MGKEVRQEHLTGFFCVNDITTIGNIIRRNNKLPSVRWDKYLVNKSTIEFLNQLSKDENIIEVYRTKRGRNATTWCHPLVFFDYAMWISPQLKVNIYKWLYDNLIIFRDKSGESYKVMAGILQYKLSPARIGLELPPIARKIKEIVGCDDWNLATNEQLQQRDKLHNDIILLMRADVSIPKIKDLLLK